MLEIKPQGKIVEKIVRAKSGEFVLATFFVVFRNGELDVQLISVSPIQKSDRIRNYELGITKKILCLNGECFKSPAITSERHKYISVVSPYFNKFEFLTKIKIRAPSR